MHSRLTFITLAGATAMAITSPASAAKSKAVPIAPETWLEGVDLSCSEKDCPGSGEVEYIVYSMTNGKASACKMLRGSGSRYTDRDICRSILRNARFEPARNDKGEPIPGYYEGTVQLERPAN